MSTVLDGMSTVDQPLAVVGAELPVCLADGREVPFANLDYAATAPCVRAAADAVASLLPLYGSVHRGTGVRSARCTLEYEHARQTVADFLGCRPGDNVVFTRNTTDAMNLLARAVPTGTTAVTFGGEHHANLLPWTRTVRLPIPAHPDEAVRSLTEALRALGRPDVLVSVAGAGNVTGELWPVAELATVAHQYGARIAVDAAQFAPHLPIDIAALDLDYVALSGHKLYAPFGAGVLAGRADWLDAAPPYLAGGGATEHVGTASYDVRWTCGPARHEAGTPNVLGAVALGAVCAALSAADRPALHAAEETLIARLRAGIADLPGVTELRIFDADRPRVGIVSVAVFGADPAGIAHRLATEYGIGVRDGLFCAHPLTRRLLEEAAVRVGRRQDLAPTALRASFGLGSTADDIDRFVAALSDLIA